MRFRFGPFVLDLDTRQLARNSREVHLASKAFDLLAALVLDRPKVLSKSVLQQRLWPDTFVVEANLSNLIAEIREALGDQRRDCQWIRTAHGVGYAFCGAATAVEDVHSPTPNRPTCWLEWGSHRFPLSVGEHIVGRDPDAHVRLDASTVSRRHAKLVVTTEGTFWKTSEVRTALVAAAALSHRGCRSRMATKSTLVRFASPFTCVYRRGLPKPSGAKRWDPSPRGKFSGIPGARSGSVDVPPKVAV